jgi:RNA polymerase sigma factor (sigma-70 family)
MIESSLLSQKNNADLWKEFRQGDRLSFQHMYKEHLNELFNYGSKVTPLRCVVADSIQEMFIDLWNNKSNLSHTDNIKFYLFKALRRRIVKELAKNRKCFTDYDQTSFENTVIMLPLENRIIEVQNDSERKENLRKAISKLSERQQEVVSLIFYEGFSYEEVSKLIGINLRSTYTLAWKALASLRKEILRFVLLAFLILP